MVHNVPTMSNQSVVVPKTSPKEIIIAVLIGLLVIGGVLWGITKMHSESSSSWRDGIVLVKSSTPRPTETEITIGKAGTSEKTTSADFTLEVQEKGTNRVFAVDVDQAHYDKTNVGDPFRFILPQGTEPLRVVNP